MARKMQTRFGRDYFERGTRRERTTSAARQHARTYQPGMASRSQNGHRSGSCRNLTSSRFVVRFMANILATRPGVATVCLISART